MKIFFIFLWFLLTSYISLAQTFFEYDNAGNRVKRTFTPVPNLVSTITVRPTTVYPSDQVTLRLAVREENGANTNGLITVKLSKQTPKITLTFNSATTTVAGTPVQNANWTFSQDNYYYTFTSTTIINAGGQSVIGLDGAVAASGGGSGRLTYSAIIVGGSGGEIKVTDNVSTARMDTF